MPVKLNKEGKIKLLDSANYREFISFVLELKSNANRKFGYADLARSSGFVSRSFPRDIVLGNKPLTLDSLNKISKGLGLSKDLTQYFLYLVELEFITCRRNNETTANIKKSLKHLKSRLLEKENGNFKNANDAFKHKYIPRIYAALGNEKEGASAFEIKMRTNLSEEIIFTTLKSLEDQGLAVRNGSRYFSQVSHPSLQNLNSESHFKKYFQLELNEIGKNLDVDFTKDFCLFFNSCFTISINNAAQLKEDLRELLLKYVDENDSPDGDKVVSLTCSLR